MTLVHWIQYLLIRLIASLVQCFPLSWTLRLAPPIGFLLFSLVPQARRMALENLRLAFGSAKTDSEMHKIALGAFTHLAEFGIEWFQMPQLVKHSAHYLIRVDRGDQVQAALQKKKGAIVLICHTGNWEIMALMGGWLVAKPVGASVYAVARPLKNPYLYEYTRRLRGLTGLKSIGKSGGVQETLSCLRANGIVCVLIDQRVSEGSVETSFFGRPALTTSLPAIAALRVGSPVFFNFLRRTDDCRYVMEVEGPVPIESSGDVKRDVRVNTQKFTDRIEREIRKDPARWLWMHNRWRVQHGPKD